MRIQQTLRLWARITHRGSGAAWIFTNYSQISRARNLLLYTAKLKECFPPGHVKSHSKSHNVIWNSTHKQWAWLAACRPSHERHFRQTARTTNAHFLIIVKFEKSLFARSVYHNNGNTTNQRRILSSPGLRHSAVHVALSIPPICDSLLSRLLWTKELTGFAPKTWSAIIKQTHPVEHMAKPNRKMAETQVVLRSSKGKLIALQR